MQMTDTAKLWSAAGITFLVFLVVYVLRRYAAARGTKRDMWMALGSVVNPSLRSANPGRSLTAVPPVKGLLVGADNRLSTSKITAFLWTAVVFYFILAIALISGFQSDNYTKLIHSISPLYLVFLGGPFAAAVLAKGIVSSAVDSGVVQKSAADKPRLADAFSDDDGNTDLVDTQYILFNLLVAGIVVAQFVHAPRTGTPPIPDFLAILTGGAAATYVANKGVSPATPKPAIDRVVPPTARVGANIRIVGSHLLAQGDAGPPTVLVDGFDASPVSRAQSGQVEARIPASVAPRPATVTVRTPAGAEVTEAGKLTVVADGITVTTVTATDLRAGGLLTLAGTGFYAPGDVDPTGAALEGSAPASVEIRQVGEAAGIPCPTYSGKASSDYELTVALPGPPLAAGDYEVHLRRSGLADYTTGKVLTLP
jgi:hypothetical protein